MAKNKKLDRIERREKQILRELRKVEKEEHKIEHEESRIKKLFDSKSVHSTQFARAFIGSTLGIVLSSFLFGMQIVHAVSMNSALVMFLFTVISAAYVSYKTEKGITTENMKFSLKHTAVDVLLYISVGFLVTLILLSVFGMLPGSLVEIFRVLLIYSLPAVAGALTLTLI